MGHQRSRWDSGCEALGRALDNSITATAKPPPPPPPPPLGAPPSVVPGAKLKRKTWNAPPP